MWTNNFTDKKQTTYSLSQRQGRVSNTKSPFCGKFSRTGNVGCGQLIGRKLKPFAGDMSCGDSSSFYGSDNSNSPKHGASCGNFELEKIQECMLGGIQTRTPKINLKIPKLVGVGGGNHDSVLENRPNGDPSSRQSRSPPDRNSQLFYKAYHKGQIDNGWTTRGMNCRRKVLKLGGRMNIQMNTLEKKIEKMKTIKEINDEPLNPPQTQYRPKAKTRGNSKYSPQHKESPTKLPTLGGP